MGANAVTTVPVYVAGEVLTAADMNITNSGIPVFATTVTRDAAFGGADEKTLAEGQFAYLEDTNTTQYYDGAAWQSVSAAPSYAIFNESQASGTAGGTNTASAFTKRTLNTTIQNGITGCSLATSVITLPAGTYLVQASSVFFAVNQVKIKLRNTTDSTDAIIGMSTYSNSGATAQAQMFGYFTIAGSKNFEVQQWSNTSNPSAGLGTATSSGISEVYTVIQIQKVA